MIAIFQNKLVKSAAQIKHKQFLLYVMYVIDNGEIWSVLVNELSVAKYNLLST